MSGKDTFLCSGDGEKRQSVFLHHRRSFLHARTQRSAGLIVCLLFSVLLPGQEKQGITNSNYAVTNSIFLNPSASADAKTYVQLRLAGAHVFGSTNLGYLPAFNYWKALAGGFPVPVPSDRRFMQFVHANLAAEGPCLVMSKDNFGVGIYLQARSVVNVRRLPHQLTSLFLAQTPVQSDGAELDVNNAGFNNMSWIEGGINFSYILLKKGPHLLQLGTNLSYLSGFNLVYGNVDVLEGTLNQSSLNASEADAVFLLSEPGFHTGTGYAGSFGFTYKKMLHSADRYMPHSKLSGCTTMDYKYKLGFSLRDLGYIKFSNVRSDAYSGNGIVEFNQPAGEFTQISASSLALQREVSAVRAVLPLSASLQFDYNFGNHFYLAALMVKRLSPHGIAGVQAADVLALVPRVEFKNIEVALPVSLQRYIYPDVGLAIRLRSFVLGTENILPVVMRRDTRTAGMYCSLSFSLFRNPACRKSSSGRVDACAPQKRFRRAEKQGLIKRILRRNKTYRR